jgi:ABC-type nitrate/sulfonate/bicarbonate transport system ATPase subunit
MSHDVHQARRLSTRYAAPPSGWVRRERNLILRALKQLISDPPVSTHRLCALANDPKILLLDEPFGALDNQTRALMQEMLLGIWERDQKTVLFVTHDIEEAIFLGSRVIVMSARPGRIKAEIAIDLPHPRSYKIKTTPEFVALKERLVEEIRTEALKVAADA